MKPVAWIAKAAHLPGWTALAQFSSRWNERVGFAGAALLTIVGVALSWHLPRQRMAIEEQIKDGHLTEEQARRRLRIYHLCAPVTTIAGMALLVKWFLTFAE
ncbi:MAG TPA: hypothetical protein VHD62_06130 [Opitutaceae bacterium]|nr:hypothetical protein [Opitutaceae bacterium]